MKMKVLVDWYLLERLCSTECFRNFLVSRYYHKMQLSLKMSRTQSVNKYICNKVTGLTLMNILVYAD